MLYHIQLLHGVSNNLTFNLVCRCAWQHTIHKKDAYNIRYHFYYFYKHYSIITNISKAHIKNFKNIETTLKTKSAIFKCLNENDTAIVNIDDSNIAKIKFKSNKITTSF